MWHFQNQKNRIMCFNGLRDESIHGSLVQGMKMRLDWNSNLDLILDLYRRILCDQKMRKASVPRCFSAIDYGCNRSFCADTSLGRHKNRLTCNSFTPGRANTGPDFKKACSDHDVRDVALARTQSPHPFNTITSVADATLVVLANCIALQRKIPSYQWQMLRQLLSATALLSS